MWCTRILETSNIAAWRAYAQCTGTAYTARMAPKNDWAQKVLAVIQSGNAQAAMAQIKVAPSVRDIQALRKLMEAGKLLARYPDVDRCTLDTIDALNGPRLHRAPPGR